jgi:hypothetical protein
MEVRFLPGQTALEPAKLEIQATYQLKNTGNRPLGEIDVRLPSRRRVQPRGVVAEWEGKPVEVAPSPDRARNSRLTLPAPWTTSGRHTLKISYEIVSAASAGDSGLRFTNDAFFLPAADWSPEMLPQSGLLGFGGSPPKNWELRVHLPPGFLVHSSGKRAKLARERGEQVLRAIESPADYYPFVVAGRYTAQEVSQASGPIILWTRAAQSAELRQAIEPLARSAAAYDATFGPRSSTPAPLWIVECPDARLCFSNADPTAALLLGEGERHAPAAEMISSDTVLVDLSAGVPNAVASAAPSLAASWLGYGKNPGFYEQVPPLSLLPAFAAAVGSEAAEGPSYRTALIRRALGQIPRQPQSAPGHRFEEPPEVVRAKSLLFFFALEDRYGPEVFHKATSAMLDLRRGRGFAISDLIASFDHETGQYDTATFVRLWMKHPGVPEAFRARYESSPTAPSGAKETLQ